MADGADLLRFQRAADPDHDGGRRFRLLAGEQRPFRQHQMDAGGLDAWLWAFVDGRPIVNHWRGLGDIPASTPLSISRR